MKIMFLFCMARVAVAVAGLAVMAYVALGCTWAAIEETAPIAQSDHGACLRVDYPLIAPGACSEVGIERVTRIPDGATSGWVDTKVVIPAAEWWLVKVKGAGYTVIRTDELRALTVPADTNTDPDTTNSIRIPGPVATLALSRAADNDESKLQVWEAADTDTTVTIYRLVTAPAPSP